MSCFRPAIDRMTGYTPGEQPQDSDVLKLNTNENPYPPSPAVFEAIREAANARLRKYPDPVSTEFCKTAGAVLDIDPAWIMACNGSDDALTILTRASLDAGDLMVVPTPSYPLYATLAQIQGCCFEQRAFTPSWKLPSNFCSGSQLAIVANPNSPTGTFIKPAELLQIAESADGLLVVDEAYVDFADENCMRLVERCPRLVVTRTLSKSYGLAGIRFGYVVAQPPVIQTLLKVKDSYNCDALSQTAAAAALRDQEYFRTVLRDIRATRERLETGLAELGFDVTPSHANFVWARRQEPVEPIYLALKQRRVYVRYLSYPGYAEGLRISVGTDDEIDGFFAELQRLV